MMPSSAVTAAPARAPAGVLPARAAVRLCYTVALLATAATATGLLWTGGSAPEQVTSVRGETVTLFGEGLYRFESVFKGAGHRGTDLVTLLLGVPLLLGAVRRYRRASVPGTLMLVGVLGWFLYLYATMAVGAAHNEFFLVYVALFGASLFGVALVVNTLDLRAVRERVGDDLPARTIAGFLVVTGLFTVVMWGAGLVTVLVEGQAPGTLGHATTTVTEALDLAIVVPLAVVAACQLFTGRLGTGSVMAVPVLLLLTALAPVIAAQTVSQLRAGVELTTAEVAGPIAGFIVLGGCAAVLLLRLLRALQPSI